MPSDLLEQLADTEVPPLPVDFRRRVHRRLNHRLLAVHLGDLLVRGLPFAITSFAQALFGLIHYSASGQYPTDRPSGSAGSAEDRPGGS